MNKFQSEISNYFKIFSLSLLMSSTTLLRAQTGDTVYVEMAAIDQPMMYNRLGAANPVGMMFALVSDLVNVDVKKPGSARLRSDKRPRPIVLRANVGNVLKIKFTNLLAPYSATSVINAYNTNSPATVTQKNALSIYPKTRYAGVHIKGMELASSIRDDGSLNGSNYLSLVKPGESIIYFLLAVEEGVFMLYSSADVVQKKLTAGQLTNGLFGSINIQPEHAEWYRSQITEAELKNTIVQYKQLSGTPEKPITTIIPINKVSDIYSLKNTYPVINYNAVDASGKPILKMYIQSRPHFRQLVYTDLTAIITGPNAGPFSSKDKSASFYQVAASPDRREPFREFSIHYHEAVNAVQAFPIFYNSNPISTNQNGTLNSGTDNFAINYGIAGIGAEVYANRIGVGPMANCSDCSFEEFFLSAWTVGDPAMVVDIPANASGKTLDSANLTLQNQFLWVANTNSVTSLPLPVIPKATKALYPDDPSNVYHSYMNDHVKFRVTHAGAGITHVHHQHAHQWLHSPNSDNGHYMDSQAINPGDSYTLEMVHGGSGNLNKTVGDQIFHCHFYPHFAAGMWSMWRVHDVLELGTKLNKNLIPDIGSRALPDGEISAGTVIPGLVPIPTQAMAPIPAKTHIDNGQVVVDDISVNPGFPFFIPGIAGHRPPNPPLDYAQGAIYDSTGKEIGFGSLNGGLPRSVIVDAKVPFENHTVIDWTKIIDTIQIIELPEEGTDVEKVAMATHAIRNHPTLTPSGKAGNFILNGLPPVPGAPFADPAMDKNGNPVGKKRTYKAAVIQLDAVFNKKGWHYPQQRMESLWGDVASNIDGTKAPEPLFFRANSQDEYVEFWHTNLVPEYFELDDFEVRTPTDILGQHIHLVKFDVTSSDGAANGFNYEDGTLSPDLVRNRIDGINQGGKHFIYKYQAGKSLADTNNYSKATVPLKAQAPNPIWGKMPKDQDWRGAQTTIQRWYVDPLLNSKGNDRTLTTVFTHDHFGPSTHQQVGLYAGLVVEPKGSIWLNSSTGKQLGTANNGWTRDVNVNGNMMQVSDGGPTDWQANIITKDTASSYREFMLEFQDVQSAYLPNSIDTLNKYPEFPVPFTGAKKAKFLADVNNYTGWHDPSVMGNANNPNNTDSTIITSGNAINYNQYPPDLVSINTNGTYSLNYRNEPLPLRLVDTSGNQVANKAGDLAYVFKSMQRADPAFNSQPVPGSKIDPTSSFIYPKTAIGPGMNPTDPYTPLFRAYENDNVQVRTLVGAHLVSHYFNLHGVNWLFEPTSANSGFRSTQNMGISEHFEMYFKFPSNKKQKADSTFTDYLYNASSDINGLTNGLWGIMRAYDANKAAQPLVPLPNNKPDKPVKKIGCGCPTTMASKDVQNETIWVVNIDRFRDDSLIYNNKYGYADTNAVIFLRDADYKRFKTDSKFKVEPFVLRTNAGKCLNIVLRNDITEVNTYHGNYTYAGTGYTSNINLSTSASAGLHAELLSYDVRRNDGSNVGFNPDQTADSMGATVSYQWYAGKWESDTKAVPVEFGTVALSSPDPMQQYIDGLIGALIVEPAGAVWTEDANSPSSANVFANANDKKIGKVLFREFVLQFQDNVNVPYYGTDTVGGGFSGATVTGAINYKSDPLKNRLSQIYPAAANNQNFNSYNLTQLTANNITNGTTYPETPHLVAKKGTPLRFRLVNSGGSGNGEIFNLNGHVWQEEPYQNGSKKLGQNDTSQWLGYRDQLGALNSFDILINSAGGKNKVTGDYLYNSSTSQSFINGMWGIMTVTTGCEHIFVTAATNKNAFKISGKTTVHPVSGKFPATISLAIKGGKKTQTTVQPDGSWNFETSEIIRFDDELVFESSSGGKLITQLQLLSNITLTEALKTETNEPVSEIKGNEKMDNVRGIKPQSKRIEKKK